jgi:tripartite-type tricarboxylate transporter receptor subunit TctC
MRMSAIAWRIFVIFWIGPTALAPVAAQTTGSGQAYPARSVRVVNPFAPGGGLDLVLRPTLQKMGESLKQTFVVDNRPGAAGVIGTDLVAKSPPDGYTLLGATTGTITINPSTYAKLPFDSVRDLAPITSIASASFVLVTHPSLAARNARELVTLAKRRPGELTLGSPGYGGINHVGGEYFSQLTGIRLTHVPFKGSSPMLIDIMGGHVMIAFDSIQATLPHIKAGKLRAIGHRRGETLTHSAGNSHDRRIGRPGDDAGFLVRPARAGRHAARSHRKAPRGGRKSPRTARSPRAVRGDRHRAGGQHTGSVRCGDTRGHQALGEGRRAANIRAE